MEPEDLVQETLMRFMDQTAKGLFDNPGDNLMGWLIKVMTRHFYDLCRSATSRRNAETDPTITRWTFTSDDVPATYERITQEQFDRAVRSCPRTSASRSYSRRKDWTTRRSPAGWGSPRAPWHSGCSTRVRP